MERKKRKKSKRERQPTPAGTQTQTHAARQRETVSEPFGPSRMPLFPALQNLLSSVGSRKIGIQASGICVSDGRLAGPSGRIIRVGPAKRQWQRSGRTGGCGFAFWGVSRCVPPSNRRISRRFNPHCYEAWCPPKRAQRAPQKGARRECCR